MTKAIRLRLLLLAAMIARGLTLDAAPLGSAFTYQGVLNDGGTPANGRFDLRFMLYDSAIGGSSVGTSNVFDDLLVTNGLLAASLDFGRGAFNGEARWLEIGVRPGQTTGAYTALAPRQPLTASPFALYSAGAANPPRGMALVPAGPFIMGDTLDGIADALPAATTVSAFYMDVNEVTLSLWRSVYHWATNHSYQIENPGLGGGGNHPVQHIDWFDCVKWCNARSQQEGLTPVYYTDPEFTRVYTNGEVAPYPNWNARGYRLPTEAEWEKAARGGLSGQRFPWGLVISQDLANYPGNTNLGYDHGPNGRHPAFTNSTFIASSPVGSFAPNGYGLNDMAGNVLEWCWDWYGLPYHGGTDPQGPHIGTIRILRGGAVDYGAAHCRVAARLTGNPSFEDNDFGFRTVRRADAP